MTWGIKIAKFLVEMELFPPKLIRWEGNVWFTTDWKLTDVNVCVPDQFHAQLS